MTPSLFFLCRSFISFHLFLSFFSIVLFCPLILFCQFFVYLFRFLSICLSLSTPFYVACISIFLSYLLSLFLYHLGQLNPFSQPFNKFYALQVPMLRLGFYRRWLRDKNEHSEKFKVCYKKVYIFKFIKYAIYVLKMRNHVVYKPWYYGNLKNAQLELAS